MSFFHDLRWAVRWLGRNPGFAAVCILVLGLGVGANTVIYGIADVVVFQPLPGKQPERLVSLYSSEEKDGPQSGLTSYPSFQDYRRNLKSLSALAAYRPVALEISQGSTPAERVSGELVSENFFGLLGIAAVRGRTFSDEESTARGSNPVALLSQRYWKDRFHESPDAIGSTIRINGQAFAVIGVAPDSLRELADGAQVWLPMSMAIQAEPMLATQIDRISNDFFHVIARLQPRITLGQAQAELDTIAARLGAGTTLDLWGNMEGEIVNPAKPPADAGQWEHDQWKKPWLVLAPAQKGFSPDQRRLSWLLLGVSGLVLVIAIADVGGLLLVRAEQEEKERAIRVSLGASRWRLLRSQFLRGLLLAGMASATGLVVGQWAGRLLLSAIPAGMPLPAAGSLSILNWRVAALVIGGSCFAAIIFSVLPGLRTRSNEISEELKLQPASWLARSNRGSRMQAALVLTQIATAMVLLVGSGLLIRTMRNAGRIDLGFDTDHVLSASLDLARHGYNKTQGAALLPALLQAAQGIPGAASGAVMAGSPVSWRGPSGSSTAISADVFDCDNLPMTMVSPGYFDSLRIPMLRGRDFSGVDSKTAPGVVIVNQAAANRCWPQRDPVGQSIPHIKTIPRPFTIVGVVGNIRSEASSETPAPQIYTSLAQFYDAFPWQFPLSLLVRSERDPRALAYALNDAAHAVDPNLLLYDLHTPRELLGRAFERQQFLTRILGVFSALALVLAIAGLYGMLSYLTAQRTREFGIRMALGAEPGRIVALVMRQGFALTAAGVCAGALAALWAARLLRSVLFGVSPTDSVVLIATVLVFLTTGLVACLLPAYRAMTVDPITALRNE